MLGSCVVQTSSRPVNLKSDNFHSSYDLNKSEKRLLSSYLRQRETLVGKLF